MNNTSNVTPEPEHPFFKALDFVEIAICFISISAMTLIICLHVVFRYVLLQPLQWSEEVARMMNIWVAYGGASYAFRRGVNIGVTALVDKLPKRPARFIQLSGEIVVIAFFIFVLWYSAKLTLSMVGITSVAAGIPMVIPYSALPIGSALVLIRLSQMFCRNVKNRNCGHGGTS